MDQVLGLIEKLTHLQNAMVSFLRRYSGEEKHNPPVSGVNHAWQLSDLRSSPGWAGSVKRKGLINEACKVDRRKYLCRQEQKT